MNYWLICLTREDMEHCIKKGVFGLSRKNYIAKVEKGDKIICCAGKGDWKIIATGEATSNYYVDDQPIFLKQGLFVDRFNFTAKKVSPEKDIIAVLDQLSFVTNMAFWAVFFRNGIAKLTKHDWELCTSKFNQVGSNH